MGETSFTHDRTNQEIATRTTGQAARRPDPNQPRNSTPEAAAPTTAACGL